MANVDILKQIEEIEALPFAEAIHAIRRGGFDQTMVEVD